MNASEEDEKISVSNHKWQNVSAKNGKQVNNESPKLHQKKKQILIHLNRFNILNGNDDDLVEVGEEKNESVNEAEVSNTPHPPPLIIT